MKRQWFLLALMLLLLAASGGMPLKAATTSSQVCGRIPIFDLSSSGSAMHPRIAATGDRSVIVVWEEKDKASLNSEIWLKLLVFKSTDVCEVEQTIGPFNVSGNAGASVSPDMALMGGGTGPTGLVVWQDTPTDLGGKTVILLRRFELISNEQGQASVKLGDILTISEVSWPARSPSIAIDRFGHSYVAWVQGRPEGDTAVFFQSAAPFAPKVNVSKGLMGPASVSVPRLAAGLSKVYVVWQGTGLTETEEEIFISQSGNPGESFVIPAFSFPMDISGPGSPDRSLDPAMAIEKSTEVQVVVWSDYSPRATNPRGGSEIFLRRSTDGFSPPINVSGSCLTKSTGNSSQPAITSISSSTLGSILVAWSEDVNGNQEIFFAQSNFQTSDSYSCINITEASNASAPTPSPGRSSLPALAADSLGNAYIAWEEEVSTGTTKIYLAVVPK